MKVKNILMAAVAALATALPGHARVEPETATLLNMINDEGVVVMIDSSLCRAEEALLGAYITYQDNSRSMVICPGEEWDAEDHSTVRHEMAHALQHCVNIQRGTDRNTPIIDDTTRLSELVNKVVPEDQVVFIKSSYPREKWLVEFEANYVERALTSTQLIELWNKLGCREVFNV